MLISFNRIFPGIFLLWIVWLTIQGGDAHGQCKGYERIYAVTQSNSNVSGTFLGLGDNNDVSNPSAAVGSNLSDFSTITIPLLPVLRYQDLGFPQTVTNSAPVHIKLASTVNLALFSVVVEIQAYNSDSPVGTKVTLTSGALLNLLSGENIADIVITNPGASYDAIRISVTGAVLSSGEIKVYAAYVNNNAATDLNCENPADILTGITSGVLGTLNGVTNPANAADNNPSSFATLRKNVGVAGYLHVTSLLSSPAIAGDSVKVQLSIPGSNLLDLTVFTKITVVAYHGNTEVANLEINSNLLLLRLLDETNKIFSFTFPVGASFDRISIQVGGLADAVSTVQVYDMRRIIPDPVNMIDNVKLSSKSICYGQSTTLSIQNIQDCTDYEWYNAATGGSVLFTGTSYIRSSLSIGTHNYYIRAVRQGCSASASGRSKVEVIVTPLPSISLGGDISVCQSVDNCELTYTLGEGNPTKYSISWSTADLDDIAETNFTASPIKIPIPQNTPAGTYPATMNITNADGCSKSVPFNLIIHPKPNQAVITAQ